ncbi:MAG: hypothetical protein CME63_09545 [Halobacteriovoraceae bacterium]|nr:hypothetical protein [Halobacteriovoraceae bacterium]MBC97981.1 hypothetical protein [Halobacteriovoraceae bacterium]|tara:strand:- start:189440 stop:190255 length:816 start_codon:yes stop_codon:yes gene_type:complete
MTKVILAAIASLTLSNTYAFNEVKIDYLRGSLNSTDEQSEMSYLDYNELSIDRSPMNLYSQDSSLQTSFKQGLLKVHHNDLKLDYDFGQDSFLSGIQNIQTQEMHLHYKEGERLLFQTQGIELQHTGGSQQLPELSLQCRDNSKNLVSDIAHICLKLAELSIPELNFDDLSAMSMAKVLNQKMSSIDSIENLKLYIFDGSFQMQFKVKYLFNWTVKSNGTIKFDEDKKLISIYLQKAKVGIISLKGKILDQIRDANLESVRVEGSMIYIQL